ncbi:MAG: hypothetical protein R3E91_00930 [Chlamydiales bacterium]
METRALKIPLPIQGKMTKKKIRSLLNVLQKTLSNNEFEKAYQEEELPKNETALWKEKFLSWQKVQEKEFMKMIDDFNATSTRPLFTFALETPSIQAAIQNPSSPFLALEAAKSGNIFKLEDGTLSLLPQESIASIKEKVKSMETHPLKFSENERDLMESQKKMHFAIGQIPKSKILEALELLTQKNQSSAPVDVVNRIEIFLPKVKNKNLSLVKGTISFKFEEKHIQGTRFVELKSTIKCDNQEKTRTTRYELKEKEKADRKFHSMLESKQFERDLLLAKSEFINAYL